MQGTIKILTIGRGRENDIVINDPTVTRACHAQLEESSTGVYITDMNSKNGTLVNGRRISQRTRLYPGDKVLLGDYYFPWAQYVNGRETIVSTGGSSTVVTPQPKKRLKYVWPIAIILIALVAGGAGAGIYLINESKKKDVENIKDKLTNELEQLKEELNGLNNKLSQAESELAAAKAALETLDKNATDYKEQLAAAQKRIKDAEQRVQKAQREMVNAYERGVKLGIDSRGDTTIVDVDIDVNIIQEIIQMVNNGKIKIDQIGDYYKQQVDIKNKNKIKDNSKQKSKDKTHLEYK